MISPEQARCIAWEFYENHSLESHFVILDSETKELEDGYWFVANTEEFLNSGDFMDSAAFVIIVRKMDGRIFIFHSAYSAEDNLKRFHAGDW